ncbi:MAG TPA: ArsR family transcriptional regulator [Pyrodictium sp.]|nr:ArsR family transcriptional regulator [Pyrodictium sp.]
MRNTKARCKRQLLELIVGGLGQTIEQLAKKLGKDESTVRRWLQTLAEQKLVKLEGRPAKPQPAPAAKS